MIFDIVVVQVKLTYPDIPEEISLLKKCVTDPAESRSEIKGIK